MVVVLLPRAVHGERYAVAEGDVSVRLVPDWDTIQVGEPLYASLWISNETSRELSYEDGCSRNALGRPEHLRVTAVRADGLAAPIPDAGSSLGGVWGVFPLKPGERRDLRLFLPHWATIREPGTWTLTATRSYRIHDGPSSARTAREPPSRTVEVSVTATLTVLPHDPAKTPVIVARWDRRLHGWKSDHDAAVEAIRAIGVIEDPRALDSLAWALGHGTYDLRMEALRGLERFPEDGAIDAIRSALALGARDFEGESTTPQGAQGLATNVRVAAASALARNSGPRAWDALVTLEKDPEPEVRLTLVHALGRRRTAGDVEALRRLADDPTPLVSAEAKRYLAEVEKR